MHRDYTREEKAAFKKLEAHLGSNLGPS